MLDNAAVVAFERDFTFTKPQKKKTGRPAGHTGCKKKLIDSTLQFMRKNEGRMPSSRELARLNVVNARVIFYYFATLEDLYQEVLKDEEIAAERGALLVKRMGVRAPCPDEPPPWDARYGVWKWWREEVLIKLARNM